MVFVALRAAFNQTSGQGQGSFTTETQTAQRKHRVSRVNSRVLSPVSVVNFDSHYTDLKSTREFSRDAANLTLSLRAVFTDGYNEEDLGTRRKGRPTLIANRERPLIANAPCSNYNAAPVDGQRPGTK